MRNLPVCKDKCNIPCAWCDLKDKLCNIENIVGWKLYNKVI